MKADAPLSQLRCPSRAARLGALIAVGLLVCSSAAGQGYVTIWNNGPTTNRINMVFLGDGYQAHEIGTTYVNHIDSMLNHMFYDGEDPFPRYRNFYNVYRVDVVSNESGADKPPEDIWRDTALDASYYSANTSG